MWLVVDPRVEHSFRNVREDPCSFRWIPACWLTPLVIKHGIWNPAVDQWTLKWETSPQTNWARDFPASHVWWCQSVLLKVNLELFPYGNKLQMVLYFQPVYWCDDGGCWILGGWLGIGFAYQFPEWPNGAGSKMRVKNSMFWWRLDCSNIWQPYCWCLNEEFRLVWIIGRSMFNDKWYCFFDCLITFDYWVCLQIGYP